jgi:hypothetical protein
MGPMPDRDSGVSAPMDGPGAGSGAAEEVVDVVAGVLVVVVEAGGPVVVDPAWAVVGVRTVVETGGRWRLGVVTDVHRALVRGARHDETQRQDRHHRG